MSNGSNLFRTRLIKKNPIKVHPIFLFTVVEKRIIDTFVIKKEPSIEPLKAKADMFYAYRLNGIVDETIRDFLANVRKVLQIGMPRMLYRDSITSCKP